MAALPLVVRGVFQQFETATAIDADALEPVGLGNEKLRRHLWIGIEVLNDDAIAAQRQIQHIGRLPGMLHAIDQSITTAFKDHHHLSALEFQATGTAARRNLLGKEKEG